MDKKTVGVGALVALIVALGVTYFTSPGKEVINTVRETVREIVAERGVGAVPGDTTPANRWCIGELCTETAAGACINASTTILSVQNPFRATSTVEFIEISGKSATSTIDILVGTSSTAAILTDKATSTTPVGITPSLIAAAQVASSSGFYFTNAAVFGPANATSSSISAYNSTFWHDILVSQQGIATVGLSATTSAIAAQKKIVLGPDDYVVGLASTSFLTPGGVTNVGGNSVITSAVNEFSCNYVIEFKGRKRF